MSRATTGRWNPLRKSKKGEGEGRVPEQKKKEKKKKKVQGNKRIYRCEKKLRIGLGER